MYKYLLILFFFSFSFIGVCQNSLFERAKGSYQLDTAIKYGELYYQESLKDKNELQQFEALCFLVGKYNTVGLYEKAEKNLLLAEQLAKKIKDKNKAGEVYMRRADLEKGRDNFAKSLENYLKAEEVFLKMNNYSWLTRCYVGLAEFYRKFADFDNALKFIDQAFLTIEKAPEIEQEIEIKLNNRAAAIHNEFNNDKNVSIGYSRKAIQLSKKAGDDFLLAVSYNEIGYSFKNSGFNDSAEYYYRMAEEKWISVGAYLNAVHAMSNRGMLYAHNDFPREKINGVYNEIIEKVKKYNIPFNLTDVYLYLYYQELKQNNFKSALEYFRLFHDEELKKMEKQYDADVVNITEKYENEKIKDQVDAVNRELKIKNEGIQQVKKEKTTLTFLLFILGGFFLLIIVLLIRINLSNKKLKVKNEEKDVLLKEVHHRVKNNLQVITSILELQSFKAHDQETREMLSECRDRINSMSLVHKQLYQRDDLAHLSFSEFLNDLILALKQSHKGESEVDFIISGIEEVIFDVDTSIPLGLILNELITNAFKHAQTGKNNLIISIQLEKKSEHTYFLIFKDNGVGLPSNIIIENSSTMGLSLIRNLVKQLGGSLTYHFEKGATFNILFLDTVQRKQKD